MQVQNSSKPLSKIFEKYFFEISLHFLVEDSKPLSPDMRIIFLLSIMKKE